MFLSSSAAMCTFKYRKNTANRQFLHLDAMIHSDLKIQLDERVERYSRKMSPSSVSPFCSRQVWHELMRTKGPWPEFFYVLCFAETHAVWNIGTHEEQLRMWHDVDLRRPKYLSMHHLLLAACIGGLACKAFRYFEPESRSSTPDSCVTLVSYTQ